ncbi:hypothetical protein KSC_001000 [Ktedonobacter sp. SOSP1-52]|uniref:alpha/beta hydrolase n=1 Tax=Ktedonobacter sp. SOSP1-52 TaxID=2778366 RepID=UPI001914ED6C|nr:alpha/beta fold hydrolase [Ktedonobacter sp. SOSP1-52]GHO61208.1 hypothetical protein KSC_001000 [Ktedonobacter sp. SOSP1-52]
MLNIQIIDITSNDIDLSGQIDDLSGEAKVVTTTFAPASSLEHSGILVVLVHGGSYTRRYWDLIVPGYERDAYSCALYLARRGHVVVTLDMLGTGESNVAISGDQLTPQMMAQAIDLVIRRVKREGTTILCGHSMGAYISHLAQSAYASADALMLLGNNIGQIRDIGINLDMVLGMVDEGYISVPRPFLHPFFHGSFPPPTEVIAADDAYNVPVPLQLMQGMLTPGKQVQLARNITVPLFLVFGEEDSVKDPEGELSYFPNACSRTAFILPASAHCHNFSAHRTQLWKIMNRFARLAQSMNTTSQLAGADL